MSLDAELSRSALESVTWGILIVTYPYLSGLVAGSFVVSTLSHVFRQRQFAPLAPLAVLVTFAILVTAPLTVLAHSRQPGNFLELYTRAHIPYSPIGDFIVIWSAYVILMLADLYFTFRAQSAGLSVQYGWRGRLNRLLALGRTDLTPNTLVRDARVLVVLSVAGIVMAFLFHGYVGFIFGSVKGRPLWTTPLMPVLFIVSAVVSGLALMWLVYGAASLLSGGRKAIDRAVSGGLLRYLMVFLLLDLFLDAVDFLNSAVTAYAPGDVALGFKRIFLGGPLTFSYLGIQLTGGVALPLLLWLVPRIRRSLIGGTLISLLVLIGVFAMRWNVVIGGQLQSKVSSGLLSYQTSWLGYDSVQTVIGILFLALFIFEVLAWVFPWRARAQPEAGTPSAAPQPRLAGAGGS